MGQMEDIGPIRVHLPHTDDDLQEHYYIINFLKPKKNFDYFRMLSPFIKATNILPGVKRKDVTIIIDEELRQALEMRDGIIEHFSQVASKVNAITGPKKYNLVFNILQLPEKHLRGKITFKSGPDMDVYLQSGSIKSSRPEPVHRVSHNMHVVQRSTLNNTDISGVYMTPPNSPWPCSDFCEFFNNEEEDQT